MDQESQSIDLLYDYFYQDSGRIKSLISQMDHGGLQISFKTVKTSSDKSSHNASVKIPFVKAGLSAEDSATKSSEKSYDSTFNHPLNLLSILQKNEMLKTSLSTCALGDVVLINGSISVFDTKMAVDAMPFLKKMMATVNGSNKGKRDKEMENAIKHSVDMFSILPTSTQIDLVDTEKNSVWMSVDANNLTINTGDIVLKYGAKIPGTWYMLGIVDAKPDAQYNDNDNFIDNAIHHNDLKSGFAEMFDLIKSMAGRPNEAYGITPIIIFRSVS
ncbi:MULTISPECIES: DUF6414 family protein [unclassified Proteus (in: enterobacteria)]|uniref:DUF6414 family protein n=1 Tax=unclassified Proteus (in: enterobacteria) TaxID=257482 RepID=UPI00137768AE|nr:MULTISPECIES: hypothetical protein [unclassified Proteus (in: enterobacteria)]NBM11000.1 hypothetical protein [Proteus sp. G2670]NBM31688.1 hypothetical protein [Proteus sp. G2664]NBM70097.1 hypothetical protein [Proteus sp. G2663]